MAKQIEILGKDNFTELDCHSFDHVDVFYVISVEVVVGDFAFLKKWIVRFVFFDN